MIIKHPMDFGTMRDKIAANGYQSVTEFKVEHLTTVASKHPSVLELRLDWRLSWSRHQGAPCAFTHSSLHEASVAGSCKLCGCFCVGLVFCKYRGQL